MNIFQLIKGVLDEAYDLIEGSDQEKDEKIRSRIGKFHQEFGNILKSMDIDYEDPVSRFAYIYVYVTSHANIVYENIKMHSLLGDCFDGDKLVVTCIGGGPGSDFLGIIKYMTKFGKKCCLYCNMLDKEKAWHEPWMDVDQKVAAEFRLSTNFVPLDVTEEESWRAHRKVLQADLFTLIYFISEVSSQKDKAEPYFNFLFSHAKSGAKFLFVDNGHSEFYNWFDNMAQANGIIIKESDILKAMMPYDEEASDLAGC